MSLDDKIVNEWELRTGQAVSSVDALAKAIKAEQAHEKKLQLIRAELDKQSGILTKSTQELTRATKSQGDTFTWASVKGNLYTMAISAAASAMKDAVRDGLEWDDTIGRNVHALDAASSATAGMIDKLTLQGARMKLTEGEFHATETQLTALSLAAVQYGRITREDFGPALDKLTTAIVSGAPSKAFRKLGLDVQFTGDKSEQMAKALGMLEEKFGGTTVKVENASEAVDQAKAAWRDFTGELFGSLTAMTKISGVLQTLTGLLRTGGPVGEFLRTGIGGTSMTYGDYAADVGMRTFKYVVGAKPGELADLDAAKMAVWKDQLRQQAAAWTALGVAKKLTDASMRKTAADMVKSGSDALNAAALQTRRRRKVGGGGMTPAKAEDLADFFGMDPFEKGGKLYDVEGEGKGLSGLSMKLGARGAFGAFDAEEIDTGAMRDAAAAIGDMREAYLLALDAAQKWRDVNKEVFGDLREMGLGAVNDFAAGMWNVADAVISGEESMGMAIAKMTKSILLGIAEQASIKALFYAAEEFGLRAPTAGFPNPGSMSAGTAAIMFGAVALAAGGGGLAISAATRSGSGGSRSSGSSGMSGRRASYGSKKDTANPIYVTIYIDPTKNGAARYVGDMEMKKVLAKAA